MSQLLALKQRIGAWLMRHSLTIFFGIMALLAFSILIGGKKSQEVKEDAEQVKTENVLTKKQVKAKDKVIAILKDSIETVAPIVRKAQVKSDSARVVIRKLEVKNDSLERKILRNENTAAADDDPTYLAGQLTNYTPQSDTLPDGQILR